MRVLQPVSPGLEIPLATVAVAQTFDGTVPLVCTVTQAHGCLPMTISVADAKEAYVAFDQCKTAGAQ